MGWEHVGSTSRVRGQTDTSDVSREHVGSTDLILVRYRRRSRGQASSPDVGWEQVCSTSRVRGQTGTSDVSWERVGSTSSLRSFIVGTLVIR